MFTLEDIRALILTAGKAGVAQVEVEKDGWKVSISRKAGALPMPAPATPRPVPDPARVEPAPDPLILAPGHGVFHHAVSPDDPPYARVGQDIDKGQQVGIVEAMKVFSAITSPFSGRIVEILVENGQDVEAGQPLFRLQ